MPYSLEDVEKLLETVIASGIQDGQRLFHALFLLLKNQIDNNTVTIDQLKKILIGLLDAIFAPKQIINQVSGIVGSTSNLCCRDIRLR
jgi:hypothetical protein